jgi:hypothetical protein
MKRLSPCRRTSAFTLFEIIIVMSIMMLIVGIGYASFSFFEDEDPFEKPVQQLSQMSKFSLNTAVIQHRGMLIAFSEEGFGVVGSTATGMGSFTVPKNVQIMIKRWQGKGWEKAEGQVWRFGEQGICEPLKVRFEIKNGGTREVTYNALTGGTMD